MEESEASNILKEIISGYSKIEVCGKTAYLKHYCEYERSLIYEEQKEVFKYCVASGIPTEKQAISLAYKNGLWSEIKEKEVQEARENLDIVSQKHQKLQLPSHKKFHEIKLQEASLLFSKLDYERRTSIGRTAEEFSNAHGYERFILSLIFSDEQLTVPFYKGVNFTAREYDDVDHTEIVQILEQFKEIHQIKFCDNKISRLILSPFYSNYFNLGEYIGDFFNKHIFGISVYQARLLSLTKTFLNIFKNYRIPESIAHDPDAVITFMKNENAKTEKQASSPRSQNTQGEKVELFSSKVGATEEDIKSTEPGAIVNDGVALVQKHGGHMNMMDIMKANNVI